MPRQSREASSLSGDLERVVHAPGHARVCQAQCGLPGHQPRANQSPCPQGVCWKSEIREVAHFQSLRGPLRDLGRGAHRLCALVSSGGCSAGPELHPTLCPCRSSLPCDFCRFHSVPSPANCVAGFSFPICEEALKTRVPGDSQRARGGETGTHGQRGSAGRAGEVLEITAPPKCGCV